MADCNNLVMYLVINCVCACMIVMYFVIYFHLSVISLHFYVDHFCKGYPSGI